MALICSAMFRALVACGFLWVTAAGGPALPGDPEYWIELSSLQASDGTLSPDFDPKKMEYTLRVTNNEIRSVTLTLGLDFEKYSAMHLPKISIDEKDLHFSPLEPITYQIDLSDCEAYDRTWPIKIADPSGPRGLLNTFKQARQNTYLVRVMQPAHYSTVVRLEKLKVTGVSGKAIELRGTFSPDSELFTYMVPPEESAVVVQPTCKGKDTSLLFDGEPAARGEKRTVQLDSVNTQIDVTCVYHEKEFGTAMRTEMYTVVLKQPVDLTLESLRLTLRIEPELGFCAMRRSLKEPEFICRSHTHQPAFVTTYANPHAEVSLQNAAGEKYRLQNGLPRFFAISDGTEQWKLVVDSGEDKPLVAPVLVIRAAKCSSLKCPAEMEHKKVAQNEENSQVKLCFEPVCTDEDVEHCCKVHNDVKAASEQFFRDMDKNNDGKVELHELDTAIDYLGKSATKEEEEGFIKELDTRTPDGAIEFDEWQGMIGENPKSEGLMRLLDHNGDNYLGLPDLEACILILQGANARSHHMFQGGKEGALQSIRNHLQKSSHFFSDVGCTPMPQKTIGGELFYYDESCTWKMPRLGGLGCYAAGLDARCRFCGFKFYAACPTQRFDCFSGACHKWSGWQSKWCKDNFGFTCPEGQTLTRKEMRSVIPPNWLPLLKFEMGPESDEVISHAPRLPLVAGVGFLLLFSAIVLVLAVRRKGSTGRTALLLTSSEGDAMLEE